MKFAQHLFAHSTPEWRKQYIQYQEMKALLYAAIKRAPSSSHADSQTITDYFDNFEESFFHFCEKELEKVNTFYFEQLKGAILKSVKLRHELENIRMGEKKNSSFWKVKAGMVHFFDWRSNASLKDAQTSDHIRKKKMSDLKLAYSEYYLSLIFLRNFQDLNFTGFRKILKKHDKLLGVSSGAKWVEENAKMADFHTNKEIDELVTKTEQVVIMDLENGNRQKAMKELRVLPMEDQQSHWISFKVGFFAGLFLVLLIIIFVTGFCDWRRSHMSNFENQDGGNPINWPIILRLYRGPFLLLFFIFLMSLNVYGWRRAGVNHVLIFEINPRNHLTEQNLMEIAAIFGFLWASSFLIFLYSDFLNYLNSEIFPDLRMPRFLTPLFLVVGLLAFLLNPFKMWKHAARFWLLSILGRIVGAPFFQVKFADFWLADQLVSLVPVFLDLQYFVCFFATSAGDFLGGSGNLTSAMTSIPEGQCMTGEFSLWIRAVLACLPAWLRFMQCLRRYRDSREAFPHLANAFKYSTTFIVVIFATLRQYQKVNQEIGEDETDWVLYCWIAALSLSSSYGFFWDLRMDWGLFEKKTGKNRFLRNELVYESKTVYFLAILEDLILRFVWAVSIPLVSLGFVGSDTMSWITALLEIFKRFVWNFFRLENEFLNNCGKFRAVRDIPLAHHSHIYRQRHSVVLGLM